jgi:DNA-binding NtrC family response regulator
MLSFLSENTPDHSHKKPLSLPALPALMAQMLTLPRVGISMKSKAMQSESKVQTDRAPKKRVLVFSPDVDVASSLMLLLEDRFEVTRESNLQSFKEKITSWQPALILADAHPLPQDIMKLVEILKERPHGTYAILLHVYRNWRPAVETAIRTAADFVFYKPINVGMIASVISDLLEERNNQKASTQ